MLANICHLYARRETKNYWVPYLHFDIRWSSTWWMGGESMLVWTHTRVVLLAGHPRSTHSSPSVHTPDMLWYVAALLSASTGNHSEFLSMMQLQQLEEHHSRGSRCLHYCVCVAIPVNARQTAACQMRCLHQQNEHFSLTNSIPWDHRPHLGSQKKMKSTSLGRTNVWNHNFVSATCKCDTETGLVKRIIMNFNFNGTSRGTSANKNKQRNNNETNWIL